MSSSYVGSHHRSSGPWRLWPVCGALALSLLSVRAGAQDGAPLPQDPPPVKEPGQPLPTDPVPNSAIEHKDPKEQATGAEGEPEPAKKEELLPEQPAPAKAVEENPNKPTLKIGAGIILWYYQPLINHGKANVDTFFARITVDGRAGIWGAHIEPRFRDNTQRSFEFGPIFIQEGYLSANTGPVTVKVGKAYSKLGLFWDNSFYGNVQVYDGLKLAPDYGASVEAIHELSSRFALGWTAQYFIVDGRTNVSLPARDIVSVPTGRRRQEAVARVDPELRFGPGKALRIGLSGQIFKADLPNGNPTVIRGAIDAKLQFGGLGVWGEFLHQSGRHVTDFPIAGTPATATTPATFGKASSNNNYVLAGGEYTYGWVTARFNVSYGNYADVNVSERFFVPALGVKPIPELLLLAEYVHWKRDVDGRDQFLDRSLNITAHGFF
jgi:hypothetical protein